MTKNTATLPPGHKRVLRVVNGRVLFADATSEPLDDYRRKLEMRSQNFAAGDTSDERTYIKDMLSFLDSKKGVAQFTTKDGPASLGYVDTSRQPTPAEPIATPNPLSPRPMQLSVPGLSSTVVGPTPTAPPPVTPPATPPATTPNFVQQSAANPAPAYVDPTQVAGVWSAQPVVPLRDPAPSFSQLSPTDNLTNQPGVDGLANYLKPGATAGLDKKVDAMRQPATTGRTASPESNIDYVGLGLDAARAVGSAIGASQPLPEFNEDPAIVAERNRLLQQRTQGMTASEAARLDTTLRQQQAARNENMRLALGGGGSQAAWLAGQAATAGADTQAAQAAQDLNEQRKREAAGPYANSLMNKQLVDYQNFQQAYNNVSQSRNAFAQGVAANLQHASDNIAYSRVQPYTMKTLAALSQMQAEADGTAGSSMALTNLMSSPYLTRFQQHR